jgi:Zn-dependent metalloprotease
MKNLFLACLIIAANTVFAQTIVKEKHTDKNGNPKLILFEETEYSPGQEFEIFREQLNLGSDDELKQINEFTDEIGETHRKYQQYYKGLKVEYGNYKVHIQHNKIKAVSGNFVKPAKILINPQITEKQAFDFALKSVNAKTYLWDYSEMENWIKQEQNSNSATTNPRPELIIWSSMENQIFKLAYKFDIYAVEP